MIETDQARYVLKETALIRNKDGRVPLTFWQNAPNFGDLLSPWLFGKLTGHEIAAMRVAPETEYVGFFKRLAPIEKRARRKHYVGIGSIISRVRKGSVVWGTGSFGTEQFTQLEPNATYKSVRGPLTRQLLRNVDAKVPEIYGDPALLVPFLYKPALEKKYDYGLVLRWSEQRWMKSETGDSIKIIDLGRSDIEGVLDDMLQCRKIITSSLHGLVIADAYGIPNAYLASHTPKGGIFKYVDYFLSVDKIRPARKFNFKEGLITAARLEQGFDFDDRPIKVDYDAMLRACPFLTKVPKDQL